jgi:hypothetical protein
VPAAKCLQNGDLVQHNALKRNKCCLRICLKYGDFDAAMRFTEYTCWLRKCLQRCDAIQHSASGRSVFCFW